MKVLVCGGRDYTDAKFVEWVLDTLNAKKPINLIIHGCASGADTFAEKWAHQRAGQCTTYGVPADWKKHGPRAGPVRNRLMLEHGKPQLVVAFEGGAGTRDMTAQATAAGVKVLFAEKLRQHYQPLDFRVKASIASRTRMDERNAGRWAAKSTGTGTLKASCDCKVLPWEDCAHTLAH